MGRDVRAAGAKRHSRVAQMLFVLSGDQQIIAVVGELAASSRPMSFEPPVTTVKGQLCQFTGSILLVRDQWAARNEKSCVLIEGGAPGVNHCVSWMWLAVT